MMKRLSVLSQIVRSVTLAAGLGVLLIGSAAESRSQEPSEPTEKNQDSTEKRTLPDPDATPSVEPLYEKFVPPQEIVQKAFDAPKDVKSLSKRNLWIDAKNKRVIFDGYVAMNDGPLEMFACPVGTKEHESIIGTLPQSKEVHAALLAVGAQHGTPVEFLPRFVPATGQRIRIWVCYWDKENQFHAVDGRTWVKKADTGEQMEPDWVFAGSGFWKDPSDGREYYRADSGDMICVSNFNSAMLDVPIASSAEANDLQFIPFTDRIPPRGTPLRLVLVPIPLHSDKPAAQPLADAKTPPKSSILPRKNADGNASK
ncbi:MAG: YdjY domain-containing protein [Rubripirellula sp.]